MLQITKKLKQGAASEVKYSNPEKLQNIGVEMLISLNITPETLVTGPEVGLDMRILVTKCKPHFFFDPEISSKSLNDSGKDSILCIQYKDYHGNERNFEFENDEDNQIKNAIHELNDEKNPKEI